MGEFKVGDWVVANRRGCKDGEHVGVIVSGGYSGFIVEFRDGWTGGHDGGEDDNAENRWFFDAMDLTAWTPAVGDRVVEVREADGVDLVNHWNTYWKDREGALTNDEFVVTGTTTFGSEVNVHYSNRAGGYGPQSPAKYFKPAPTPANGRKVGPAEKSRAGLWYANWKWALPVFSSPHADDGRWSYDGTSDKNDLIAACVPWPTSAPIAAAVDTLADEYGPGVPATPKAKFRIGDKVDYYYHGNRSEPWCGTTITSVHDVGNGKFEYNGSHPEAGNGRFFEEWLRPAVALTKPTTTPAIVCLIGDGQPLPAARPYVHANTAGAAKEAKRLASKHKGQAFGVFVQTGDVVKVEPDHEWQKLARTDVRAAEDALSKFAGIDAFAAGTAVRRFRAA